MGDANVARTATLSNSSRQNQLIEIMRDAVIHVLERPTVCRGPYVITDEDLKPYVRIAPSAHSS